MNNRQPTLQWLALAVASALITFGLTTPAATQTCIRSPEDLPAKGFIAEYHTDITANDLTNSRGVRLTDFRHILQQDRFNAHERGETDGVLLDNGVFDPFDLDDYFTTLARRQQFATADYSLVCPDMLEGLADAIEDGQLGSFLYVRVFPAPGGGLRVYMTPVG